MLGARKCQLCRPLPQEYERASKVDQFVTRFLLRETVRHFGGLGPGPAVREALGRLHLDLRVQFMNVRYLHVSGPSAPITFHSSGIPEPKFLFLGKEVRRGREGVAGFAAGPQCPEAWGQACSGAPVLGPMGLGAVD